MAEFGITQARRRLGFTPSTSTPINLDARGTGGTGGAIGQALVAGLEIAQKIHQKRQQMTDANSNVTANGFRATADQEFEAYKLVNQQDTWVAERQRLDKRVDGEIGTLTFSKGAAQFQQTKSQAISQINSATALTSATRQLRVDTIDSLTSSMVSAFSSGDQAKIAEATRSFANNADNMGKDDNEVIADIKTAQTAGQRIGAQKASNIVYAAIEVASSKPGLTFDIAKELAKNPAIPEDRQATLRSAINTAEKAKTAKIKSDEQKLKDETTSDTIREYYQGTITVAELDKRHEAGLIKDPNYESMRKGLEADIPDISGPFNRSTMNRAITQFKSGAMSRNDVQEIFLANYDKLDKADRKKFGDSIEDVFVAGQQNSLREAKSRGATLISPKFQGGILADLKFDSIEDEKRFDLEWRNRNLYEDALDDWVTEQAKKKIDLSPRDIRIRANDLLIDYRKTKELDLDQFEARVLGKEKAVKRTPLEKSKTLTELQRPATELSTAELQAEAKRLRSKQ